MALSYAKPKDRGSARVVTPLLSVRIAPALKAELSRIALVEGRTLSNLVIRTLHHLVRATRAAAMRRPQ